jgi:hypothetical protein
MSTYLDVNISRILDEMQTILDGEGKTDVGKEKIRQMKEVYDVLFEYRERQKQDARRKAWSRSEASLARSRGRDKLKDNLRSVKDDSNLPPRLPINLFDGDIPATILAERRDW